MVAGIDPGYNFAIVVVDSLENIVDVFFKRGATYNEIKEFLLKYHKGIIAIATDKQKTPETIKTISRWISRPVITPKKDISKEFKIKIKSRINNNSVISSIDKKYREHVIDAYSAAIYAIRKIKKQLNKYEIGKIDNLNKLIESIYYKQQNSGKIKTLLQNMEDTHNMKDLKNKKTKKKYKIKESNNDVIEKIIIIRKIDTNNKYNKYRILKLKKEITSLVNEYKKVLEYLSKEKNIFVKVNSSIYKYIKEYNRVFIDNIDQLEEIKNSNAIIGVPKNVYKENKDMFYVLGKKVWILEEYIDLESVVLVMKYKVLDDRTKQEESNVEFYKRLIKHYIKKYRYNI